MPASDTHSRHATAANGRRRPTHSRANRRRWWFGALTVLCIAVGLGTPLPWLLGLVERVPDPPALVVHLQQTFVTMPWRFLLHVMAGAIALLVGPWQFMARIRVRHPNVHRGVGWIYVTACAIAGAAGLALAMSAFGGVVARLGFAMLAMAWLVSTGIAVRRAVERDLVAHRRWMIRSFVLTCSAVSLRVQMPLLELAGLPQATAYAFVAWSCWLPSLATFEWLARREKLPKLSTFALTAR